MFLDCRDEGLATSFTPENVINNLKPPETMSQQLFIEQF
jgi:hypothetical protein